MKRSPFYISRWLGGICCNLTEEANTRVDRVESFLLKTGFVTRMQREKKTIELGDTPFGKHYSEARRQFFLPPRKYNTKSPGGVLLKN